ncbi:MAG: heme exporter protein CcmB [Candidatus Eisenbacteria bacterium]|nr:heme exporter protein CcmB [Candidatus Eisenbacteria bacterium]
MKTTFLSRSLGVARKDWLAERRAQSGLASTGLFALVTLAVLSFSVGPFGAGAELQAALLWIILLFSGLSGLSRVYIREVDSRTAPHLKLLAGPLETLIGKTLFNLWLLVLVELMVVPLFLVLMAPKVRDFPVLLATLALADIGLVSVSTLLAAVVAQARTRGALFSGLAIPVLIPLLLAAIGGTKAAFGVTPDARTHLVMLASLDAVLVGVSVFLIEPVWNE